jgi:siroheme synthase-like protein
VSGYPLLLSGERIAALVVGGGPVAHRKVMALLESGATVRVVAPTITAPLREAAARAPALQLTLVERAYQSDDIADATIVIAATDSRTINARVAADGRSRARLVNVVDAPDEGNCVTVAAHRAGPLVVGVSAGGVPRAAARVRDAVAERFDERYAIALAALDRRAGGDARAWSDAEHELVGPDFCATVESGAFADRVTRWG